MRVIALLALVFTIFPAFAKQVRILCTTKAYSCIQAPDGFFDCGWRNTSALSETRITLNKDNRYPNPDHPYEVWNALYAPSYDGHQLHLRVVHKSGKDKNSLQLRARLDTPNVSAETSGSRSIDVALRNDNFGRGFYCPTIEVLP